MNNFWLARYMYNSLFPPFNNICGNEVHVSDNFELLLFLKCTSFSNLGYFNILIILLPIIRHIQVY